VRDLFALLVFVTAVYGLANAIAVLKFGRFLFGTWKERKGLGRIPYAGDLFYCPPCLAFWIGMAASKWFVSPAGAVVPAGWKAMIADGLVASAFAYLAHVWAEKTSSGLEI
jgi:uncharacterized protein YbdZ (MbtH family)